jgi:hypothetical protein
MELAVVALIIGPSCIVFAAGCLLALVRTWRAQTRSTLADPNTRRRAT